MVTVTVTARGMGTRGWKLGDSWKDWRSPPSSYRSLCHCFSLHGPQMAEPPPPPWQLLIMGSCQGHQSSHPITTLLLISFFLVLRNSSSMLFRRAESSPWLWMLSGDIYTRTQIESYRVDLWVLQASSYHKHKRIETTQTHLKQQEHINSHQNYQCSNEVITLSSDIFTRQADVGIYFLFLTQHQLRWYQHVR